MIRIAGVTVPDDKWFPYALSVIKGIGPSNARKIADALGINYRTKMKDLSEDKINEVRTYITENYVVEGDLIRDTKANIKRLKDISAWRGLRHKAGLPVRGQTTKNNNRTIRGNKRITAGSGRAKSASKT
ncbi:MAG: 30S ribosomal protein S13 [Patescibacteria group bacterium]